ncbi:MAG: hypothetical protein H6Q17_2113 [Bacteroidetes bacterium]|nr:hypothetical protein [Bacteroidota bacterium]
MIVTFNGYIVEIFKIFYLSCASYFLIVKSNTFLIQWTYYQRNQEQ